MTKSKFSLSDLVALFFILLTALIVYAPVLVSGRVLLPADLLLITPPWAQQSANLNPTFTHVLRRTWDPLFQFYPSRKFLAESLQQGWIPLWNPHAFSGTPFAADGQSAVFYPINWLFALLPLSFAFGGVAFLHSLLTGLFFYVYGRKVGWSAAGSTAGAIVWMLCGVQIGWQMWQVVDSTLCWLPLCLLFWEYFQSSQLPGYLVGLAASIAMTLLAGHLQFAFYVLLTVATYALYRLLCCERCYWKLLLGALVSALTLGVALAGVQLAATVDLLRLSIRISAPIGALLPSALSPAQLGLLVMPELFGGERDYLNHTFLAGEYYEKVIYCGASALVFAFFALRLKQQGDLSRYWLALAFFALLLGCGTPLYDLFYYGVPLYKSFHGLSRVFVLFDFAIAALASSGITLLQSQSATDRKKPAQMACGAACLFVIAAYRFGILDNGHLISYFLTHDWLTYGLMQMGVAIGLMLAASLLLLVLPPKFAWAAPLLVTFDMLVFACGLNPGSSSNLLYPPTPETSFVSEQLKSSPLDRVLCVSDSAGHPQSRITPNGAMSLGWNDIAGSDPLILSRYDAFVTRVNMSDTGKPEPAGQGIIAQAGNPALDEMNVRWIVSPSILNLAGYRLACTGAVNVYQNTQAIGPAWLTSYIGGAAQAPGIITRNVQIVAASPAPQITSNGPGRLIVRAQTQVPAMLNVSQTYCPGWATSVDGRSASVRVVDGLWMGIYLRPGVHYITLSYVPMAVRLGLYVSLIGWLIAAFLAATSVHCKIFVPGR